ncbi:MAG TPA: PfkB family carbohydrate kinase [Polyangia bacterium]|nr:PfkB family carbohydrate kinase [Polyangia bacterium]
MAKAPKRKPARKPSATRERTRPGLVVGVGLATVDLLCVAPRIDERLVELSIFSMQGGGSVSTALAMAATLGAKARFFGRLADDDFGRFVLSALRGLVDTTQVSVERGKISPVSLVNIDELTRKRKIMFTRGSTTPLLPRDLPPRLLDGASLLVIDGYQPALQAAIAEKARAKGITVLLNAGHLVGGMGELLALSDIVIGSERFASEFAPSDDVQKSLREITRIGPRVAVITMGEAGAMALEDRKLVQQEAIDVFVADTTGAGDVFCGAFAYASLQRWPLERALPFANAAAGLTCRSLGAQSALPTLAEVVAAAAGRT